MSEGIFIICPNRENNPKSYKQFIHRVMHNLLFLEMLYHKTMSKSRKMIKEPVLRAQAVKRLVATSWPLLTLLMRAFCLA